MAATVKGTVVRAGHDYMRQRCTFEEWEQVLSLLPDESRTLVAHSDKTLQFPVSVDGQVFAAFARVHCGGDLGFAERELRMGGASQADAMLAGVFSVFARMVSPQAAFSKAGSIITSVYTGVTHETELSAHGRGGLIKLKGLGESSYVAPWQCGWMERALIHFKATNPRVIERSWAAGSVASDELVYEVDWA